MFNNGFVNVPNTVIEDSKLSWKARGLFLYLMSFGQNQVHSIADVIKGSNLDGRGSTLTAIKELISHGYVHVSPVGKLYGNYPRYYVWRLTVSPHKSSSLVKFS